ncbi:GTPase [Candidatus Micrarchaeota archaeon]|nr:GTPase [Candidatus Micrarchaeota archaeon]MBD3418237.1 GTPase [Candidatus Micrarchaeota archaeon]
MQKRKALILGAAGRDFHNFNTFFRNNENYEVIGFTAAQIPGIEERKYPSSLSGFLYPDGIPIFREDHLETIIKEKGINDVAFSYSDVTHEHVMHLASRALAAGASYLLLGPNDTCIPSTKPLFAICATRTGAGKSPLSKLISKRLAEKGVKLAVIRHPMPYGDLEKQEVQRFSSLEDLDRHNCTIEEREEYEGHIKNGALLFAGVDYEAILREAEKEADLIMWDGGNNDYPFYSPNLMVVVSDALRPEHGYHYFPGEVNLRMADIVLISKASQDPKGAEKAEEIAHTLNPNAHLLHADIEVSAPDGIQGKEVIVVEDGPTLTHGGMEYGAGLLAAKKAGAIPLSPVPYAVGSIKNTFKSYPHTTQVLPAMGYGKKQVEELQETINSMPADTIISGTPMDISKVITTEKQIVQVNYSYKPREVEPILDRIKSLL